MNTKLISITRVCQFFSLAAITLFFANCSVLQKTSLQDIPEGKYFIPQSVNKSFLQTDSVIKNQTIRFVNLFHERDSIFFLGHINPGNTAINGFVYPLGNKAQKITLLKPSFDLDIFTTPFKFRPAVADIPQQFNTNFNGSFYLGYRIDRYVLQQNEVHPSVIRERFNKSGVGLGAFFGVGSVFINPKFMNNAIDYEYDAFAVDYGFAALFGIRNFSTGVSVGFDFLADKNRKNWVYQHKPWVGIFIGLNLN